MGEREGGRKGRSSRYSDDLTVFSLFLFLSMRVRVYIREREREKTTTKRDRERGRSMRGSNFLFGLLPRGLSQNIFLSRLFRQFFCFFVFFVNAFLPSSSQKEHRKEEEEEEDFRLSFLFPSFVCEIKPFLSSVSSYHYYYGYKILLQQC